MSAAIAGLLSRASKEQRQDGAVSTHTAMLLAAEGYDLAALDNDLEQMSADTHG